MKIEQKKKKTERGLRCSGCLRMSRTFRVFQIEILFLSARNTALRFSFRKLQNLQPRFLLWSRFFVAAVAGSGAG